MYQDNRDVKRPPVRSKVAGHHSTGREEAVLTLTTDSMRVSMSGGGLSSSMEVCSAMPSSWSITPASAKPPHKRTPRLLHSPGCHQGCSDIILMQPSWTVITTSCAAPASLSLMALPTATSRTSP